MQINTKQTDVHGFYNVDLRAINVSNNNHSTYLKKKKKEIKFQNQKDKSTIKQN